MAEQDSVFYAQLYKKSNLKGGHVILLNGKNSPFYEQTKCEALKALRAYPNGLQVGGGITAENASEYLAAGASHVIVTSYVFQDGTIHYENLNRLVSAVGKDRVVLDLSCRKKDGCYYVVTDRWQKFTEEKISEELLDQLSEYADEFLIHAVDVEGKASGIEKDLVKKLADWGKIPITYAGGIGSFQDLEELYQLGRGIIHATIGSALDIFGGSMNYETVVLLSQLKQKPDDYIDVTIELDDVDITSAETKATYDEIKKYVAEHNAGMKVSNLYISQVKRKCGIEVGKNYNLPKNEDSRQPQCPEDKVSAIVEALKHFKMIQKN